MAAEKQSVFTPKAICFSLGFFGMGVLALLMFYPALMALFFGGGVAQGVDQRGWSMPLVLLSLIISGWLLLGLFALLWPALISQTLSGFLKKDIVDQSDARQQFKHGRAFVLGSLAGKVLIWPAAVFGGILVLPFVFGYTGWSSILTLILGGLFFVALLSRLFIPGILSIIAPPSQTPFSPWPFIWGLLVSSFLVVITGLTGLLPSTKPQIQTTIRTNDDTRPGPAIDEKTRQSNKEDARYYVTWKDDQFVEVETTFCANGMSVFLPKDKGFIGKSLDPDSVVYDPYAYGTDAIGIAVSARRVSIDGGWVRDLGAPWGLGTAHFRGEERVGGYDFLDQSHIFAAKAFIVSPDGSEHETEALLVPTGCTDDDLAGISLRRQLLSQLDMASHLVDNWDFAVNDTANFNLITDIPILDLDYSDALLDELDKLITAQGRRKGANQPPIIMVASWTREQESENRKIEEAKIRKALAERHRSNVVWISAGQLSPFCNIPNPTCTALNNSTTLYVPKRGSK